MAKFGQAQEEAMDAILASIRSMMSEDGDGIAPNGPRGSGATQPLPGNVSKLFSELPPGSPAADVDPAGSAGVVPPAENRRISEIPDAVSPAVARAMTRAEDQARVEVETGGAPSAEEPRRDAAPAPVSLAKAEPDQQFSRSTQPILPAERRYDSRDIARGTGDLQVGQPLMSPKANAAVSRTFTELATVLSSSGRTIDEMVEDLLRPMLREWLDASLPPMVERLVREEIERVSRGRR